MTGSLAEVLRALAAALDGAGGGWYLFGAQAVVVWGRPRFTEDIDVTVSARPSDARSLVQALERAGFRLRVADVDDFVGRTWVLPVEHSSTGLPVDVVLGASGLEAQFVDRARRVNLGGVHVPVISPEDLVVSKVIASRPKDIDDIIGVVRLQGDRLDLDYVRALCTGPA